MKHILFFIIACSWLGVAWAHDEDAKWKTRWLNYIEYHHTSSILDGPPFNHQPETQTDLVVLELFKVCRDRFYIRGELAVNLRHSELQGREPRGGFAIGMQRRRC